MEKLYLKHTIDELMRGIVDVIIGALLQKHPYSYL
jgi:hypothetical protein